jgi:hypothetical protein
MINKSRQMPIIHQKLSNKILSSINISLERKDEMQNRVLSQDPALKAMAIESTLSNRPLNAVKFRHQVSSPRDSYNKIRTHDIATGGSSDGHSQLVLTNQKSGDSLRLELNSR